MSQMCLPTISFPLCQLLCVLTGGPDKENPTSPLGKEGLSATTSELGSNLPKGSKLEHSLLLEGLVGWHQRVSEGLTGGQRTGFKMWIHYET